MSSEVSEVDPVEERGHIQRFMDRIKYLIQTDEELNLAEAIGALHILAHELASMAFFSEEDDED